MQSRPLWEHQKEGIRRALPKENYAFFFEPGCGKTRTIIELYLQKFKGSKKTVIFCPPIVIPNWVEEWKKFANLTAIPLVGSGAKRLKTFAQNTGPARRIFITNYEALSMAPLYQAMQAWGPEMLVFDESHYCKSIKAQRSKLAEDLANPFDKKEKKWLKKPNTYLLSGTPVLNSPMDVFQQFLIMDGGDAFGRNFWAFRARYFRDRNAAMPKDRYFPAWELMNKAKDGFDAEAEINERIFQKAMRVEKKDCLDLPEEISVTIKVGMSAEQARLYHEMRKDLVTYYQSQACVATLAITKALRLMQITSGFVSVEDQHSTEPTATVQTTLPETPKLAALKELLEELVVEGKKKVLVWAVWRENYKHIRELCEKLKFNYVEVHGGISERDKNAAVIRFNTDPECSVFIGNPRSGGIGINLVAAGYSIFFSRTFSLETHLQARARNHRGGSKEAGHKSITHYDLVCSDTIDEVAVKRLTQKQEMSDTLLSDLLNEVQAQVGI